MSRDRPLSEKMKPFEDLESAVFLAVGFSSQKDMRGMGRQGQRSGTTGVHHQRQYPDNFLESSSNGRWL